MKKQYKIVNCEVVYGGFPDTILSQIEGLSQSKGFFLKNAMISIAVFQVLMLILVLKSGRIVSKYGRLFRATRMMFQIVY